MNAMAVKKTEVGSDDLEAKIRAAVEGPGLKIFLSSVGGKKVNRMEVVKGELNVFNWDNLGFNVRKSGGICTSYLPKGFGLFHSWLMKVNLSEITTSQTEIEPPHGVEFEVRL